MTAAKQGAMFMVVGSYLGSHLGNGVVVGGAQYGAMYGIGGLWYGAGAALSYVLFGLVMSRIVYKRGYITLPDVLARCYGDKLTTVLIAVLHYCAMIAICAGQIMAGRLLFEYAGLPGEWGAIITFLIVMVYSSMSGLWGVLMTDVFQSSIIFVVTIAIVVWIFANGGGAIMAENLPASSFEVMPFDAETMIMMFGPTALFGLTALYVLNGFKILAGLLGLLLAGKKSLLTVIMGVILFVAQLWNFFQAGNGAIEIVINIVLLVIPYYYLHNAYYAGNMLPA